GSSGSGGCQTHLIEHPIGFGPVAACQSSEVGEVLGERQLVVQRRFVAGPADRGSDITDPIRPEFGAQDLAGTGGGPGEGGDDREQGGLSGTVRSCQSDAFAGRHLQVYPRQNRGGAEGEADTGQTDHSHGLEFPRFQPRLRSGRSSYGSTRTNAFETLEMQPRICYLLLVRKFLS